jgi:hypothetical protein
MKANRLFCAVLAAGLGLVAITATSEAQAQPTGKGKKEAPHAPAAEAITRKSIALSPPGVTFGMSVKQVATVIDKVLDDVYRPLYKKVSPGVKMKALDAALAEEKSTFRRSRINFGKLPTGIDATPLKGEYSYLNKESMLSFTRDGRTRYFFFIQDRLWKIVDEHKLSETGPLGKDFQTAVGKLTAVYGVPGRILPADPAKGRFADEVDWKDSSTRLRAVKRFDTGIALITQELATEMNLANLRPNKPADDNAIDPAVAAALAKGNPDSAGPPPDKGKKKK